MRKIHPNAFSKKRGDEELLENRSKGRKKKTLRHRRKVAFNQGNLHPLPDCSEEMRISFKIRKLRNQLHFFKIKKDHMFCFILQVLKHENIYANRFTIRLSAPED